MLLLTEVLLTTLDTLVTIVGDFFFFFLFFPFIFIYALDLCFIWFSATSDTKSKGYHSLFTSKLPQKLKQSRAIPSEDFNFSRIAIYLHPGPSVGLALYTNLWLGLIWEY